MFFFLKIPPTNNSCFWKFHTKKNNWLLSLFSRNIVLKNWFDYNLYLFLHIWVCESWPWSPCGCPRCSSTASGRRRRTQRQTKHNRRVAKQTNFRFFSHGNFEFFSHGNLTFFNILIKFLLDLSHNLIQFEKKITTVNKWNFEDSNSKFCEFRKSTRIGP